MKNFKRVALANRLPGGGKDFIPRRAISLEEEERRRNRQHGIVMLESEGSGALVAAYALSKIEDPVATAYLAARIAESQIKAANYRCAQSPVMNSMIGAADILPYGGTDKAFAVSLLQHIALVTGEIIRAKEYGSRKVHKMSYELGRTVAYSALVTACVPLPRVDQNKVDFNVSAMTRDHWLETVEQTQMRGAELGTNPSLAQYSDAFSPVLYDAWNNAPREVQQALANGLDRFGMQF